MRILHLHLYSTFGGIETYAHDLFAELEARGHQNILVSTGSRPPGLDAPGRHAYFRPRVDDFLQASDGAVDEITQILERERPDIAFIHVAISASLAPTILEAIPTVFFAHTYNAFCASGAQFFRRSHSVCRLSGVPDWRCLVNAYRQACNTRRPGRLWESYQRAAASGAWIRRADAIVCDSEYVAQRHIENGFAPSRLHVLPSPVLIPSVPSASPHRGDVVLFAGRLTAEKGAEYLIRAMTRISASADLFVAGTGPEEGRLRTLAQQLGLGERVRFLGMVDRESLAGLYATASVVVVPSLWPEPFGMVGPEAMAHGVPVVAFRVGGIPEWLLDGETGFLVEPGDIDGLSVHIEQILRDRDLASSLGTRARAVAVERFTVQRHVDRLLNLFQEAIQARQDRIAEPVAAP